MTHHYRPNLHELGQLRNAIESMLELDAVNQLPLSHEIFKAKIEEHKLLYSRATKREFKRYEELR